MKTTLTLYIPLLSTSLITSLLTFRPLTSSISLTDLVYCLDIFQQGFSTVFGSSHCQQCSNIYAFILYVNIISINNPVFLSHFFACSYLHLTS